jgi:ubiquinone/menaquinone biosynthesis C-methylase UbiE
MYGRLVFDTDFRRLYESIDELRTLPHDADVLDVPCGGGVALRGVDPNRPIRYVAADLSPYQLARARREADARQLSFVELVQTDATQLPFADSTFDLCVSYNGLHCLSNAAAAIAEIGRVLRPGGELRGTTVLRGTSTRADLTLGLYQRMGVFARPPTTADLKAWLLDAGFMQSTIETDGAIAHFRASRASHAGNGATRSRSRGSQRAMASRSA